MEAMEESRKSPAADGVNRVTELQRLYDTEVDLLYRFVIRRCGDESLAGDVVQDVFLAAASRVACGGDVPGTGWFYSTARSRLIDHWRTAARRERKLRLLSSSERNRSADVAETVVSGERLAQMLDQISPNHRAVLVLKYVDGFTVSEIASTMDRSAKSVESMLSRARTALLSVVEEVGND